jgi:hypothetical protein
MDRISFEMRRIGFEMRRIRLLYKISFGGYCVTGKSICSSQYFHTE